MSSQSFFRIIWVATLCEDRTPSYVNHILSNNQLHANHCVVGGINGIPSHVETFWCCTKTFDCILHRFLLLSDAVELSLKVHDTGYQFITDVAKFITDVAKFDGDIILVCKMVVRLDL